MILTGTFYLVAESERLWIGVNPGTVSLDANNVQASPLQVRFWAGEGSDKVAMSAYLTFRVESVVGSSVTKLFEDKPASKVSSYDYTIPSDKYATANRISIYAYEDAGRTKEIGSKQVNIIAANPAPFPRSEDWNVDNVYKNGEYLKQDNVLYMWTSRVSGNTEISPKEWIEAHQESGLWTPYPYDKLIAAEIALLNFALIGSAVFQDEYMISQQGVDASGNPTEDYRKFGTEEFTPNLLIDFLRGTIKCNNVDIRGSVVTPYIRIELDPGVPAVCKFAGRTNAYIHCTGDAVDEHALYMPPASEMAAGTEVNLFSYAAPGRLAPKPKVMIYPDGKFLPDNVAEILMSDTSELQLKVVKIGADEGGKRWFVVHGSR